ncbi:MAG: glutaredoxin family protein [Leptolyngbyaceae cyanobacterium CRU_2_3]|nr:glutaredoxin family protein [Leptolyngbyaceae cyanobacterium CRU_2_3]
MRIVLYSKPGCHLCEGLHEKLEQVKNPHFELEIRDITLREDWFQAYQYEIPVLFAIRDVVQNSPTTDSPPIPLPRISPRASVPQIEQVLQRYLLETPQNKSK